MTIELHTDAPLNQWFESAYLANAKAEQNRQKSLEALTARLSKIVKDLPLGSYILVLTEDVNVNVVGTVHNPSIRIMPYSDRSSISGGKERTHLTVINYGDIQAPQ